MRTSAAAVLLLAAACSAGQADVQRIWTPPTAAPDVQCWVAVAAWRDAIESPELSPAGLDSSAGAVLNRCSAEQLGPQLHAEVTQSLRLARRARLRASADITETDYTETDNTETDNTQDTAPVAALVPGPLSVAAQKCAVEAGSLTWTMRGISDLMDKFRDEFGRGNLISAATTSQTIDWAIDDLEDFVADAFRRCGEHAPSVIRELQSAAILQRAGWRATKRICGQQAATTGVDC